jgi:hypothetical protein
LGKLQRSVNAGGNDRLNTVTALIKALMFLMWEYECLKGIVVQFRDTNDRYTGSSDNACHVRGRHPARTQPEYRAI